MLTKEEKILCALHGIKSVLNDLGLEDIKNKLELKDGSTETIDCVNVLQEFIVDYVNSNQPYKFEDLKPNMWVWDNKCKVFNKISRTFDFYGTNVIDFAYINDTTQFGRSIKFEENRFFPVTKAMQYQNKCNIKIIDKE